jgi:hypothetical protein
MRRVLEFIDKRASEFAQLPLFAFLRDTKIDPRSRLAFAPGVAHFVMTFGDLYSHVLCEEPTTDEYQEIVNRHTREDDGHWKWFLADLGKMGFDPQVAYTDALRLIWSPKTVQMRMLSYRMCRLGLGADSLKKLVLVHCIEAAGKVTVERVAKVGDELASRTAQKLVYFGSHHSDTEIAHTLEDPAVRSEIEQIELEPTRERELMAVVDESFDAFSAFAGDMLTLARPAVP